MKGENIATRLRRLAADVIQVCRALPEDHAAKHIGRQLVRAASGGGANYEEARGAESRADFIHKVGVANKEIREALYWLQLLRDTAIAADTDTVASLIQEADELVAILTSSVKTAKQREGTLAYK